MIWKLEKVIGVVVLSGKYVSRISKGIIYSVYHVIHLSVDYWTFIEIVNFVYIPKLLSRHVPALFLYRDISKT